MDKHEAAPVTGTKIFVTLYESLKPTQRTWALLMVGIVVLAVFGILAYFCWYLGLNGIWSWASAEEPSTTWKAIKYLLAGLGTLYLLMIPFAPFVAAKSILAPIATSNSVQSRFDDITKEQRKLEDELIKKDKSGLIQLIRYSRLQLQAYYTIGLSQSKKSFRYSVLAMWIGFIVIISGVVSYTYPPGVLLPASVEVTAPSTKDTVSSVSPGDPDMGVTSPTSEEQETSPKMPREIQLLTVASGTIIEVVSALFLWVYSRTIKQLTYFYNRQSYNHTLLMCSTIAGNMSEGGDAAQNQIIEKAMTYAWTIPADNIPGLSLIQKVREAKAS